MLCHLQADGGSQKRLGFQGQMQGPHTLEWGIVRSHHLTGIAVVEESARTTVYIHVAQPLQYGQNVTLTLSRKQQAALLLHDD